MAFSFVLMLLCMWVNNTPCPDQIIENVVAKLRSRSVLGIGKYRTTLYDSQEGFMAFLKHAQAELLDEVNYLEKLISLVQSGKLTFTQSPPP